MHHYAEAAQLLVNPNAAAVLTPHEAVEVLQYMHPFVVPAGELFIEEGSASSIDYALLVIKGVAIIETSGEAEGAEPLLIDVLEPGRWAGEMSLLDSLPRQANCRAGDDENLLCAVLTRASYQKMLQQSPLLAAKLAMLLTAAINNVLWAVRLKMVCFMEINQAHQVQQVADRIEQQPSQTEPAPQADSARDEPTEQPPTEWQTLQHPVSETDLENYQHRLEQRTSAAITALADVIDPSLIGQAHDMHNDATEHEDACAGEDADCEHPPTELQTVQQPVHEDELAYYKEMVSRHTAATAALRAKMLAALEQARQQSTPTVAATPNEPPQSAPASESGQDADTP